MSNKFWNIIYDIKRKIACLLIAKESTFQAAESYGYPVAVEHELNYRAWQQHSEQAKRLPESTWICIKSFLLFSVVEIIKSIRYLDRAIKQHKMQIEIQVEWTFFLTKRRVSEWCQLARVNKKVSERKSRHGKVPLNSITDYSAWLNLRISHVLKLNFERSCCFLNVIR